MGDQVEMGDAAPVHVDVVMSETVVVEVKETFVVVEENANGHHVAEDVEQEQEQEQEQAAEDAAPVVDREAITPEEERLWNVVKENPADFNSWTVLINETEKLEVISKIESSYDAFLSEFPLCYGYWKKYADHEARLGSSEKVVEVFERAVKAVTYSVDMWMNYCIYAMEKFEDPETIRGFSSCTSFAVSAKRWSHVGGAFNFYFVG